MSGTHRISRCRPSRRRTLAREWLEPRRLLAADWQNEFSPLDVSRDGEVSSLDALLGINEINEPTLIAGDGKLPSRAEHADKPLFDASADDFLSAIDVLLVIDAINGDRVGPAIVVRLSEDTAPRNQTNEDGLTSKPLLAGTVTDQTGVPQFQASVDGGPFVDVAFAPGGAFQFDPGLATDGSDDGEHTIDFQARDGLRQTSSLSGFRFTLDTRPPAPPTSLRLHTASDTGASSQDGITRDATPTFTLDAAPGSTVLLLAGDREVGSGTTASPAEVTSSLLEDGTYSFVSRAYDAAGNLSGPSAAVTVTIDTLAPSLAITTPSRNGVVHRDSRLQGSVTNPTGAALLFRFDEDAAQPFIADRQGHFDRPLFAGRIADGSRQLTVSAEDLAGNVAAEVIPVEVQQTALPLTLREHQPLDGSSQIGVTQRVQIFFSRPVDTGSLTPDNFFASFGGRQLPATIVPANTGEFAWLFFSQPLPSNSAIQVSVLGDTILAENGEQLDADGDGEPGGTFRYSFSTVSTTPLPGTSLAGRVVDPGPDNLPHTADDLPLAGAKVFLLGRETDVRTSGSDGRFTLDSVPAGNAKIVIDGLPAPAPAGFYFPEMVMDGYLHAGRANTVMPGMEDIVLPRLRTSILRTVDASADTLIVADEDAAPELSPEDRARLSIQIPAGSLVAPNGSKAATASIGISTVPPELVVDMLPPGVLQHTFDITVQAMGVSNFSTPAPLTVPNVFDAAPGSQLNFLSFDHASGRLVIEGTMTVSADGLSATTDPGFGVTHPGWHGATPPGTRTSTCILPPAPTVFVQPVPVIEFPSEDLFFKDDEGTFTLRFENDAFKVSLNPFSDPCSAVNREATPMVVELTVHRPAGNLQFTSPDFVTQTFSLLPQQSKEIEVEISDLIRLAKNFEQDVLFGANAEVNVYRWDNPDEPLFQGLFNVYRYFDVADDNHSDGVLEFPDTLADGFLGIERHRPVELRVHSEAAALLRRNAIEFFVEGTNGAPDLVFDPRNPEGLGTKTGGVEIVNQLTGKVAGEMQLRGVGVPKTQLFVNKPLLISELAKLVGTNDRFEIAYFYLRDADDSLNDARDTFTLTFGDLATGELTTAEIRLDATGAQVVTALESLANIPAGAVVVERKAVDQDIKFTDGRSQPGTILKFEVEFLGPLDQTALTLRKGRIPGTTQDFTVAPFVDDSQITANERKLLDNLEDDGVTPKPTERSDLADAVEQALFTLYAPFQDGIELTATPPDGSRPSIHYLWDGAPGTLYGDSGPPLAPNGNGVDNFDDHTQLVEQAGKFSGTVNTFLLAKKTNQLPTTDVAVFPNTHLSWIFDGKGDLSRTDLVNALAYTAAHEGGHTLGLSHSGQAAFTPSLNLVVSTNDAGKRLEVKVPGLADCAVDGCRDLMYGGNLDFEGKSSFQPGLTAELLKVGLKIGWTRAEALTALSFLTAQRAVQDKAGVGGFNALGQDDHPRGEPILGPQLALFDAFGQLVFGAFDLGEIAPGLERTRSLVVSNIGTDPLTLTDIRLVDPSNSFRLSGFTPGTVLQQADRLALDVTLAPQASGPLSAQLVLETNDVDAPAALDLSGFGRRPGGDLRVEVDNNNAGGVAVGAGPVTRSGFAVLHNIGGAPLAITGIHLQGRAQGQFGLGGLPADLSPQTPLVLAADERLAFDLVFDPGEIGLIPDAIIITSDDSQTPMVRQPVVGTGLDGSPAFAGLGRDYIAMRLPARDDSEILRGISDASGHFSFFVPAEALLQTIAFDPGSGLVAHSFDRTAASGQDTALPALRFTASTMADKDGDGLPADAELAIGTSDERVDSNNDGVSDFDSLRAGLDPLSGLSAVTGQVGIAALDHRALDIVIDSDPRDARRPLAYIATGDLLGGLAIADLSDPTNPMVLSQLTLPGAASHVAVDPAGPTAVVSSDRGLHVLGVDDPLAPRLLNTFSRAGGPAEVYQGIAYVAQDTFLAAIELSSGRVLDTVPRGFEGRFTDIVRRGEFLYVMNELPSALELHELRILEIVDARQGQLRERGAVVVKGSGGGLFVEGPTAYATLLTAGGAGGFATIDISDPDHPRLITGEEAQTGLPRTALAGDGSGRGFLVGRQTAAPFDFQLAALDLTDPADTAAVTTIFTLPETPFSVAFGHGKAYAVTGRAVVGGSAGTLRVFNFPAFDDERQPPQVALVSPPDADAGAPGTQVLEGTIVPIRVHVTDDVQLRVVELLVDGQLVDTDFGSPFEFHVAVPPAVGPAPLRVQARAIDTGGNAGLSNSFNLQVIADNEPPQIRLLEPLDQGFRRQGPVNVRVQFDEPLAVASFSDGQFTLRDGSANRVLPDATEIDADRRGLTLRFEQLAAGPYEFAIGTGVTDRAGNPFAAPDPFVSRFEVLSSAVFWIGVTDGLWNDPDNWSTGRVPTAADDVVIGTDLPVTVRLEDGTEAHSIRSEEKLDIRGRVTIHAESELRGGVDLQFGSEGTILTLGGDTVVDGESSFDGSLTGTGSVNHFGRMTLPDGGLSALHTTLNNFGILQHDGAALELRGLLRNETSGTYDARGPAFLEGNGLLENLGRFEKSGILSTVQVNVPFQSSGQPLQVDHGELRFGGGGTFTDTLFAIGSGGKLSLAAGDFTLAGDSTASGKGVLALQRGSLIVPAGSSASFNLAGETLELGTSSSGSNFDLVVLGTVTNQGEALWQGADLLIGAAPAEFINSGTMNIRSNAGRRLEGQFTNRGRVMHRDAAILTLAGATVQNQADASWEIQGRPTLDDQPVTSSRFTNAGLLRKSEDAGTSVWDVPVSHAADATLDVQTGTLQLTRGGEFAGTGVHIGDGATLDLAGGDQRVTGDSTFAGAGSGRLTRGNLIVEAGAHLDLRLPVGVFQVSPSLGSEAFSILGTATNHHLLVFSRGGFDAPGTFTNAGTFQWLAGTLRGNGFTNTHIVDISAAGFSGTLSGQLINRGQILHSTTRNLTFLDGTLINEAAGQYDLQNTGGFALGFGSSTHQFDNRGGQFLKSGAGAVTLATDFQNSGTVELQQGTATFSRGFVQTGGVTRLSGGDMSVGNLTVELQGGEFAGSGLVTGNVQNGGTITVGGAGQAGTLTITRNFTQTAAGVLDVELGGTDTGESDLLVTNSVAGTQSTSLGGTLNIRLLDEFVPQADDVFPLLTFDGLTGDFVTIEGNELPGGIVLTPRITASRYELVATQAVRAAGTPRASGPPAELDGRAVDALLRQLIDRLSRASGGGRVEEWSAVTVELTELDGDLLAVAGAGRIVLDRDAAGFGWFLDPTPALDEEFVPGAGHPGLVARAPSAAAERMDLLSVLAHELAHLAGQTHADDLPAHLAPGARRV